MAITAVLKVKAAYSNSPLIQRRQNNFAGTKSSSVYFLPNPQYAAAAAVSHRVKSSFFVVVKSFVSNSSMAQELSSSRKENPILKTTQKWLKNPAVMGTLSFMLIMYYYGRQPALAYTVGVMGGREFRLINYLPLHSLMMLYGFKSLMVYLRAALGPAPPSLFEFLAIVSGLIALDFGTLIIFLLNRETIMKLQVCLFVQDQSLQKDLNRIGITTDISSDQNGWAHILKETSKLLLRHEEEWISGYSYICYTEHGEVAEKFFEKFSRKERSKSGVETLVNLDDMEMRSTDSQVPNEFKNTYMVVTIFVSASRMLFIPDMPTINGFGDIKEALRVLQLVSDKRLHGVNVFWTPQKQNDVLLPEDVRRDYLHLRPLIRDKRLHGQSVLFSPEDPQRDYLN